MHKTIKVLLISWKSKSYFSLYPNDFVVRDLNILQKHYDVKLVEFAKVKDILKVIPCIANVDLNIVWFGGKAAVAVALFSKLFRKKSIVIAAGADVARVPEINYGMMFSPLSRFFAKLSFQCTDVVLAVSESTRRETLEHCNVDPEKVRTVLHGFDPKKYGSKGKKEELVLTVGGVSWGNLSRKGLETFVRSAKYLRNVKFVLIGAHQDDSITYLKSIASPNVEFTDLIPFKELLRFMQRARVYVQVSAHEGFGCSLAEAMLCECVPVVTKRGAIPEVVGETGFYVPYNDPEQTAQKIKMALASKKGKLARMRIMERFPLEKRSRELRKIIGMLTSK